MPYKKCIGIIVLLALIVSCSPQTKESYIKEFDKFMIKIENESEHFSKEEWRDAEKKYILLSQDWYHKFEDELVWDEKVKIKAYEVKYNIIKAKKFIDDMLD